MAETKLNMQLLLRRDDVFTSTYVLAKGEPGFEISTNTLKIGDGVKTWANLPIANKAAIDELIKVTDDKVVALAEIVSKLDDTYATDAELTKVKDDLAAAKLDKETYNTYIASRAMTDNQINAKIDAKVNVSDYTVDKETFATKSEVQGVDAKFANYNTTAVQKGIDDAQDARIKAIEDDYLVADDIAEMAKKSDVNAVSGDLAAYIESNNAAVAKKADAESLGNYYTKTDIENKGYAVATEVEGTYATQDALAEAVADIEDNAEAIEALAGKVGTVPEGSTVMGIIQNIQENAYDDTTLRGLIEENADAIAEITGDYVKAADIADFETKENVKKVADDLAAYVKSNDEAIADRYTKDEADEKFAVKGEDSYDDKEVRGLIKANADAIDAIEADYLKDADKTELSNAISTEKSRAEGIEAGLRTDVDAIAADYLTSEDKEELQGSIDTLTGVVETLRDGIDADKVDGVKDLIDYVEEHGAVVTGLQDAIAANTKAISDQAAADVAKYETKTDAAAKLTEAKEYADDINEALTAKIDALDGAKEDYKTADAALKAELQGEISAVSEALTKAKSDLQAEIDSDVAAAIADEIVRADAAYDATGAAAAAQAAAIAAAAEDATAKANKALEDAKVYANGLDHEDTTYTVAATSNALEFTVTPNGKGEAQTVKLVAPEVDTGVMEVEAGNDIVVTKGENGKVTVAHETFTTGTYQKTPESSDKTGDVYLMTSVTVDNGHVTGANVQSLAAALMGMTFVLDGGNSSNN